MSSKNTIILGSGIGGLSISSELLDRGFKVVILEKSDKIGGVMQSIYLNGCVVDLGFRRFYCRIPEVKDFFFKILGQDFIEYDLRIGVLYKKKIYEREHRFKGYRRGIPFTTLILIILDRFIQALKYFFITPKNFEQLVYARKGKILSKVFSQAYYEKLKGISWNKLPVEYNAERLSSATKNTLFDLIKRSKEKIDDTYKWYHPRQGSFTLTENLKERILKKEGKIMLNSEVISLKKEGDKWHVSIRNQKETILLDSDYLVSTLSIEVITDLLKNKRHSKQFRILNKRNVIIVYLFLNEAARFPHTCVRITDPNTKITRLTNYGSFSSDMVPLNKGCLGLEFIYSHEDGISRLDEDIVIKLAIDYVEKKGLIKAGSCVDNYFCRIQNTDVASIWEDYREDDVRLKAFNEISDISNFYQISRTGVDKTIFAAIETAKSIETGDKSAYILKTRPDLNTPWISD